MSLPDDNDIAALHEIMNGDEEEMDSDQLNWVRRSTRPVQPTIPQPTETETETETLSDSATASANKEDTKVDEQNPKTRKKSKRKNIKPAKDTVQLLAFENNQGSRDGGPVQPTIPQPTETETETLSDSATAPANKEDAKVVEQNPKTRKKSKKKNLKPAKDTVQLFAFENNQGSRDGGRPKRKLKVIARFDSQSYNATANCKTGHGFACPGCSSICSYDSKACAGCSLPCYYEAGVGVVILKERSDILVTPKKRSRNEMEGNGVKAKHKKAVRKKKKAAKATSTKKNEKHQSSSATAANYLPRHSDGKKLLQQNVSGGGSGPSHGMAGMGKQLLPPQDVAGGSGPSHGMAGKGKQLLPPQDVASDSSTTRAAFGGSHAMGGKSFQRSFGKTLIVPENTKSTVDTTSTVAKSTRGGGASKPVVALYERRRPVVAFYERRPFVMREYTSLLDASKGLGTCIKTISSKRNYNEEHVRTKKRHKGKFMHYDFRDANDIRTARRWQRELLAVEHADFDECDNLNEARDHPSWSIRLADSHHRMRMGRKILNFMRREKGNGYMLSPQQGRGKCVGAISSHVTFAADLANEGAHEEMESTKGDLDDSEDDEAANDLIVAAIRGKGPPLTTPNHQLSQEVDSLKNSAALDNSLETEQLAEHDLSHFGRSEREEHDMVNMLNEDFPPEDHPPDIHDVTTERDDFDAKLQETTHTLQTVTEEKKDLQTKYDSLLTNSIKTEEELRETISTLMGTIRERSVSVSSFNNQTSELEDRCSVVSAERDDLAKTRVAMESVQLERDELARKLNEANSKLAAQENTEKEKDAKNAKEIESLELKVVETTSMVSELTEQLSTASAEKAAAVKKLWSATSDLSAMRERAEKILQLESSTESLNMQRDMSNSNVSELLLENENSNGTLSSSMSEMDGFASNVEESKRMIIRLETEKVVTDAKTASLEDTVEELRGRIESLSAELNAFKHQVKPTNIKNSNLESEHKKHAADSMQPDFADREAKYRSTITNLEETVNRQSYNAKNLNETIRTCITQVTELTSQVSKMTAERDELAAKIEEATAELSKLQSTFETLNAERDAAEAKVRELLSRNANTEEVMSALNSEKEVLIAKIEECITRLYSEKEEAPSRSNGKNEIPINGIHNSHPGTNGSLPAMENLEKQLRDRDAKVSKLTRDKEKLETYTKQTLQIFQQKYFATTQDYKTKLKEKTEKIQALETELANNNAEAENDPLLSSVINELNLGARTDPTSDTTHDIAVGDDS